MGFAAAPAHLGLHVGEQNQIGVVAILQQHGAVADQSLVLRNLFQQRDVKFLGQLNISLGATLAKEANDVNEAYLLEMAGIGQHLAMNPAIVAWQVKQDGVGHIGHHVGVGQGEMQLLGHVAQGVQVQGNVILLATAVGGSAREISQRSLEQLVERSGISRFGGSLGRPIINRLLPVASLASDGATTITATYAIGRRAQALCRIGNGQAQDLGELLHGLTGIDQRLLISWSGSAFRLAVAPFRAALGAMSQ